MEQLGRESFWLILAADGGCRRERLATWLAEDLPVRFEGRVINIDPQVAETSRDVSVSYLARHDVPIVN